MKNLQPSFIKWGWNVFLYLFFSKNWCISMSKKYCGEIQSKKILNSHQILFGRRTDFIRIDWNIWLFATTGHKSISLSKSCKSFFICDEEYHSWLWIFSSIVTWFLPISCWNLEKWPLDLLLKIYCFNISCRKPFHPKWRANDRERKSIRCMDPNENQRLYILYFGSLKKRDVM